jgi:transposase-like protein
MAPLSYRRHRFPPEIIQHAIWLYLRFTLSYRDVEELLAERGLDISYETVRRWVLKFGPAVARRLRQRRPRPSDRWHLDEMVVRIAGERMYLWRAVDDEGEVLDMLVQRRRNTRSALRLMRKLLKKQGFVPKLLVTDKLHSYACAFRRLRLTCRHEQGLRKNNRAENSHQAVRRREHKLHALPRLNRSPNARIPRAASRRLRLRRSGPTKPRLLIGGVGATDASAKTSRDTSCAKRERKIQIAAGFQPRTRTRETTGGAWTGKWKVCAGRGSDPA